MGAGGLNCRAPSTDVMTGLLWERRAQIGCCLLLQGTLLASGLALEHLLQRSTPSPGGAKVATLRG